MPLRTAIQKSDDTATPAKNQIARCHIQKLSIHLGPILHDRPPIVGKDIAHRDWFHTSL
jgi:hypothetical protein